MRRSNTLHQRPECPPVAAKPPGDQFRAETKPTWTSDHHHQCCGKFALLQLLLWFPLLQLRHEPASRLLTLLIQLCLGLSPCKQTEPELLSPPRLTNRSKPALNSLPVQLASDRAPHPHLQPQSPPDLGSSPVARFNLGGDRPGQNRRLPPPRPDRHFPLLPVRPSRGRGSGAPPLRGQSTAGGEGEPWRIAVQRAFPT